MRLSNWKFVILVIVIIGGSFYWFSMRPAKINIFCNEKAHEDARRLYQHNNPLTSDLTKYNSSQYEEYYKQCLRSKGINW